MQWVPNSCRVLFRLPVSREGTREEGGGTAEQVSSRQDCLHWSQFRSGTLNHQRTGVRCQVWGQSAGDCAQLRESKDRKLKVSPLFEC